jgi:hypothetical protein
LNLWAFFGKTHRLADVLVQTFGRGGRAGTNFTTFLDAAVQTLDVTWFELRDLLTVRTGYVSRKGSCLYSSVGSASA